MYESLSLRDSALEQLTAEFPGLSVRVVLAVFLGYLERSESVTAAVSATRNRILDACLI